MPRGGVDRKRSLRMNCMIDRNGNFWPTIRELACGSCTVGKPAQPNEFGSTIGAQGRTRCPGYLISCVFRSEVIDSGRRPAEIDPGLSVALSKADVQRRGSLRNGATAKPPACQPSTRARARSDRA